MKRKYEGLIVLATRGKEDSVSGRRDEGGLKDMPVIIGAGTSVTSDVISGGFVSVSFSLSPSVERLFELGSFDVFDLNITVFRISLYIDAQG